MPPKRASRRSSIGLQQQHHHHHHHHLQYASSKEECHALLGTHSKKLVVFIFLAEWCPHSIEVKEHLEAMAKEEQHAVLVAIDVDDAEDLIQFYSLYAVPSYYFFKNHEEIGVEVGGDHIKLKAAIRKYKRMKETE